MEPTDATEPVDFQPPCNCGTLGDHPSTPDCVHRSIAAAEISGSRSACLEAVGVLRAGYSVEIRSQWQDPHSKEWVFHLDLVATELSRMVSNRRPEPAPDAAVLACLDDALGLEISQDEIRVITGLEDGILSHVLNSLVKNGTIEHVRPGIYRKNQ